MKKWLVALILAALMLSVATAAMADRMYIFPDSGTRRLTRQEVEQWDYESLGFAFHEILARHGFVFDPNGNYYAYFNSLPWYTPNADPNNDRACYPLLSSLEWDNYELIKEVRAAKQYHDYGMSIRDFRTGGVAAPQSFVYIALPSGRVFPVYSAPSVNSWRGANGLAEVSTNGAIYTAGVENGWLLILYETNFGGARVGYINAAQLYDVHLSLPSLNFTRTAATVQQRCTLTDDPLRCSESIAVLQPGTSVTWLASFDGLEGWDYVECRCSGQLVRGFIPAGLLDVTAGDGPVLLD